MKFKVLIVFFTLINFNVSASGTYIIPIVFHILLNPAQINELGGIDEIEKKINKHVNFLNTDFGGTNADTALIPKHFRKIRGKTRITFALARATPELQYTNGFNVITTKEPGFQLAGKVGSGIGFSDAKYVAPAWDPTSYINIWVIRPMSTINGLSMSVSTAKELGIPTREVGLVIDYALLRNAISNRVLTHEMGHFFSLKHTWGDDDGLCPYNGGTDDGIEDTPPQALPTFSCPVGTKYDACSPDGDGIMFMNFMDYAPENCQLLFTKQQVERMQATLEPTGELFSLTLSPAIYEKSDADSPFEIIPNPCREKINVKFIKPVNSLYEIQLINSVGQIVISEAVRDAHSFYSVDCTIVAPGVYTLKLIFAQTVRSKKVIVQ